MEKKSKEQVEAANYHKLMKKMKILL